MEVSPVNKTAIIEFVIEILLLKLWKVSKNMRRRLKWMLKSRRIQMLWFNDKVFALSKWIDFEGYDFEIKAINTIIKGISSYRIKKQEHAYKIRKLNRELRCYTIEFESTSPVFISYLTELKLSPYNIDLYFNFTFGKVSRMHADSLTSEQLEWILGKVNFVFDLKIVNSTLSDANFKGFKVKNIKFENIKFLQILVLPSSLEYLKLTNCEQIRMLASNHLLKLVISGNKRLLPEELKWISSLTKLKAIRVNSTIREIIHYFPSTLRKINIKSSLSVKEANFTIIKKKLPLLLDFVSPISVLLAEKLKLRRANMVIDTEKKVLKFRPREISAENTNASLLLKHPELFENVEVAYLGPQLEDPDLFPCNLKKVVIKACSLEGKALIRLGKQC